MSVKKGFTLAEVLITLVIIGAVAALSIPSLVSNIGDQQNKIAWRKTFADISQATMLIAAENGGSIQGLYIDNAAMRNSFARYMNYIKSCSRSGDEGCWPNPINLLNGSTASWGATHPGLVLNNGSLMTFLWSDSTCSQAVRYCGEIEVDVNGLNAPNTVGKDIFVLSIKPDSASSRSGNDCTSSGNGSGCSALYLYQ